MNFGEVKILEDRAVPVASFANEGELQSFINYGLLHFWREAISYSFK
jgi:hypothetical protein